VSSSPSWCFSASPASRVSVGSTGLHQCRAAYLLVLVVCAPRLARHISTEGSMSQTLAARQTELTLAPTGVGNHERAWERPWNPDLGVKGSRVQISPARPFRSRVRAALTCGNTTEGPTRSTPGRGPLSAPLAGLSQTERRALFRRCHHLPGSSIRCAVGAGCWVRRWACGHGLLA
jgi:hypothetical protein